MTLQHTSEVNVIIITFDVHGRVTLVIMIVEYNHCCLQPVSLLFRQQCRPHIMLASMLAVAVLMCIPWNT